MRMRAPVSCWRRARPGTGSVDSAREVDEARTIAVSPRHSVLLAMELYPLVDKAAVAGLRRADARAARGQRDAAHGGGAGHRRRGDAQESPAGGDLSAALSKDVFPREAARRSAGRVRAASAGVAAVANAAADRVHRHHVSQLPGAGPVLRAPHAVRGRAAREQHRQGADSCRWRRRRGCGGWPKSPWRSCSCFRRAASPTATPSCTTSSSVRRRSSRS